MIGENSKIYLESITLSGKTIVFETPAVIQGDETFTIKSDGTILFQKTGRILIGDIMGRYDLRDE